jgi:hypothetical protein
MAGDRSRAAAYFASDLFTRQAFEDPQFDYAPKCGIDGRKPVQNILDFDERLFAGCMRRRQVGKLGFLRPFRERTGMMNQQLLHEVCRQPKERGFLVRSVRTRRPKGFDFNEFEIELMHDRRGLERVIRALRPHARRSDSPEFGVEKLDQLPGGFMVAAAKARH